MAHRNRFPGICRACRAPVPPGAGIAYRTGPRWHVRCPDCPGDFSRAGSVRDARFTRLPYIPPMEQPTAAPKMAADVADVLLTRAGYRS